MKFRYKNLLFVVLYSRDLPCFLRRRLKESGGIPQLKILDEDGEDWKVLYGWRPMDELYNILEDPECVNNLATNPEFAPVLNTMRDDLVGKLKEQEDPRMFGKGQDFDTYPGIESWPKTFKVRKAWEVANSKNLGCVFKVSPGGAACL